MQDHSVREARFTDIPALIELLAEASVEFGHEAAPMCPETTRNTLQRLVNQREGAVYILMREGRVRGILAGVVNQLWYSRKRQAVDIIYYVGQDSRGYGVKLLAAFIGWARNVPGVVEINLGIMSDFPERERVEKLFEVHGGKPLGRFFRIIPEREAAEAA